MRAWRRLLCKFGLHHWLRSYPDGRMQACMFCPERRQAHPRPPYRTPPGPR